jgi:hypothetical protein
MIRHPFGVAGLLLSTAGAFLLLKYPSLATLYTPLGEQVMTWVNNATPENRRRYLWQLWGYRSAVGALGFGFILQLIDLLIA